MRLTYSVGGHFLVEKHGHQKSQKQKFKIGFGTKVIIVSVTIFLKKHCSKAVSKVPTSLSSRFQCERPSTSWFSARCTAPRRHSGGQSAPRSVGKWNSDDLRCSKMCGFWTETEMVFDVFFHDHLCLLDL